MRTERYERPPHPTPQTPKPLEAKTLQNAVRNACFAVSAHVKSTSEGTTRTHVLQLQHTFRRMCWPCAARDKGAEGWREDHAWVTVEHNKMVSNNNHRVDSGRVHPPGKVSATSVWDLNPTGTPRIREVKEVSAKVSKSYWYAACQTMLISAVFSSFTCRSYWYAAYQAVDFLFFDL